MGATRTRAVHVTLPSGDVVSAKVHDVVDAVADPELAHRLFGGALNRLTTPDGAELAITTPVVFHDPASEVFALVASDADRHREFELRAALWTELAGDRAAAVPAYVREFAVVFGATGLTALLERKADAALESARAADSAREVERERKELDLRKADLAAREAALDKRARELDALRADLDAAGAEAARRLLDADRDAARLRGEAAALKEQAERDARAAAAARPAKPTPAPVAEPVTTPVRSLTEVPDEVTSPFELLSEIDAPELPASADPITSTTADAPRPSADPWIVGFARSTAPAAFTLEDNRARVAVRATGASGAALTASRLDARLVVQRLPEYGVIALLIGTPAALRGVGPAHRVLVPLDVAAELDRRFLATLERDFALEIDVVVDGRPARRARLTAPLTENVAFVVRAASDHLRTLGATANFARGLVALGSVADVLGLGHPEHGEFRVDKLEPIATANQARRALAIARRFSKPAREDYLACVRSFPLGRWRELRHQVLARAVELGLWMGPELAQAAVSEGLARSRKDLLLRLDAGFQALLGQASANDLDADAIDDNRQALADEAAALGVAASGAAELEPVTSGIITPKQAPPAGVKGLASAELVKLLEDRDRRLAAALELCERGDGAAARPVMNAARRMSRADAVRVLGAMVRLGPAAAPTLTAGLSSSKAFLRHGCALALALLRTEEGTEAVVDALLGEPTEIWREIARAVGHVGPPALMPLAARLGRLGERATASDRERIAWAMAHVGVRGGRHAVETLANGQSAVAPVARMAIDRMEPAASDDVSARAPVREVTVNRAFSRRFFEALERGLPELGKGELAALDASSPMELLDESDLLADDDADEELDESDLVDA